MSSARPSSTKIWAAPGESNRYKQAAAHRATMPSSKIFEIKSDPHRKIVPYLVAAAVIILAVYYLPNYFFLEKATADHASLLLHFLGMPVETKVVNQYAFIADIQIVKDCTGIQVIAVFLGLILPLPAASWKGKLLTIGAVSAMLYGANVFRIALEFWLVHFNLLPWSLAHYPLSLLLGILGVAVLVLVTDRLLPEFGGFLLQAARLWTARANKK